MSELRRVGVFCGSSPNLPDERLAFGVHVGESLARAGIGVVYGAGRTGLMGAVARGAMAAGGEVIGVIPGGLFTNEIPPGEISEVRVVSSMHERKAEMYSLADGFISLPGGLGTLEELFEAATWTQLGLHDQPKTMVLLSNDDFWAGLAEFLDRTTDANFIRPTNRAIIRSAGTVDEALDILRDEPSREQPTYVSK